MKAKLKSVKRKLKGMKKKSKNIIGASIFAVILILAILFFLYGYSPIEQTTLPPTFNCYRWLDGQCIKADCDMRMVSLYTTSEACERAHPGGAGIYYRLSRNSCSSIILTPSEKTVNDYNTLEECKKQITYVIDIPKPGDGTQLEGENYKTLIVIGVIILVIAFALFMTSRKSKNNNSE